MQAIFSIIKGIHPGFILERELKKRKLAKGRFADSINEYPQTIATITKGKRRMNPALSLKIEHALGLEEGFFTILQAYNDIEQQKIKQAKKYHPDLSKIRPVIFWDTEIKKIDWAKNKSAVIQRIVERGNEEEISEIIHFYGKEIVRSIVKNNTSLPPNIIKNLQ